MTGKVVDLTLTYTPGFTGFNMEQAKTMDNDGWNASTLTFTHIVVRIWMHPFTSMPANETNRPNACITMYREGMDH